MKDADRKNLVRPAEAAQGYGHEVEVKRQWAPVAEAAFQRVSASELGKNRLLVMSYGMSGDYLYDGVALFWNDQGPYRLVRLEAEFLHLDTPTWEEAEVPRARGDRLLAELGGYSPKVLASDMDLTENVFGEGGAVFLFDWGGVRHEAQVWAPYTLAQRGGDKAPSAILTAVRQLSQEIF